MQNNVFVNTVQCSVCMLRFFFFLNQVLVFVILRKRPRKCSQAYKRRFIANEYAHDKKKTVHTYIKNKKNELEQSKHRSLTFDIYAK